VKIKIDRCGGQTLSSDCCGYLVPDSWRAWVITRQTSRTAPAEIRAGNLLNTSQNCHLSVQSFAFWRSGFWFRSADESLSCRDFPLFRRIMG